MTPIRSKKGYDLKIVGRPSSALSLLESPKTVALLPERIPFVKPRLAVQKGDEVRIGSVLFTDKRNPDFKFVSPGGGKVKDIVFGPRRVIREIIIDLDDSEAVETFDPMAETDLSRVTRETLIQRLMDGGVWPFLRMLPFRDISPPESEPPAVYVSIDDREPFQPAPEVYLSGLHDRFRFGLKILRRLSPNVVVHASPLAAAALTELSDVITHRVHGAYPADDSGVVLYHLRQGQQDNRAWFVSGQDLLMIAGFLATGNLPLERVVSVAGGCAGERRHVQTRLGAPLNHLLDGNPPACEAARFVAGGLFRGYSAETGAHLGLYETSITLISEPLEKEFLGFVRPGYQKLSYSRAFLSRVNRQPLDVDTNRNGGLRACIACGYCAEVCPVEILPQMTLKAILAEEVEEYLAHGLLDCVECGLCSYVCPSKIELAETLRNTKRSYYKEQSQP